MDNQWADYYAQVDDDPLTYHPSMQDNLPQDSGESYDIGSILASQNFYSPTYQNHYAYNPFAYNSASAYNSALVHNSNYAYYNPTAQTDSNLAQNYDSCNSYYPTQHQLVYATNFNKNYRSNQFSTIL
ncbi:hypothetical protein QAD02_015871 [Eretmocerus hayati]|uniref:Uncharacterized protein n=1 Tax=Eretmocerus hayati TaxID=131215 RepID=A0ACC2P9W4_9HYME|nr:hypothetical protein QAD02_015871 [Eretmocerus hayati]